MTDGHSGSGAETAVDAIADQYVDDYCALDPLAATYFGIAGHDHELPDISPDGFEARAQLARQALTDMQQAVPRGGAATIARDAFLERLSVTIEQYAAQTPQSQISVISSELHSIRGAFDLMRTEGEEAWSNVNERLSRVPTALDGYRRTLTAQAERGNVSAKRQIDAVAGQIRAWTGQEGSSGNFFEDLVAPADVDGGLKTELTLHAREAASAFARFGEYLERELLPRGLDRDGVGRDRYVPESRSFLGAEIDLDETYAWGWDELARIEDEMTTIARTLVPGGQIEDGVAALDADPARTIPGKENFRAWMQDLADRTVDEMSGTHFDIPDPIKRIECCIAPTNDGGIYYTGPSEDWSRPGQMWWAVPEGIGDFSTWREVTTVYHEGVPGHHLQVAQTAYRTDLLNRWQRTMCWVSGHGEGWALYAERLMEDLGYLEDPGNRMGMLDGQALRAVRVIVDIGIHLGLAIPPDNPFGFHPGEQWTPDLGLEFMRQHCRLDDAVIQFELNRYLGWPGQAPSYKVGERIWLQARDEAKARHGSSFDLKQFHREALDLGSIGLDPFRSALATL
jgi:uncharacterized protein (DUF885 family)